MIKDIVGVYESEEEVKNAVIKLEKEGHLAEDISLVAKDSDTANWLKKETDVQVDTSHGHTAPEKGEENSFWDKVKAAFKGQNAFQGGDVDANAKDLTEFGLTGEQSKKYRDDVEQGKILVLAPEAPSEAPGAENVTEKADTKNKEANVGAPPFAEGTDRAGDPLNPENPPKDKNEREKF